MTGRPTTKRIAIGAALLAGCAAGTWAQTPAASAADVPKARCEPVPKMPDRAMWQEKNVRRGFQRDLDAYKQCMNAYLDQRKAAIKANVEEANAAINDYNGVMKTLNEARGAEE